MTETPPRRHTGTFLPKITKCNKDQRSSYYRMKAPLQTRCDKSTRILSTEEISQFRNSLKQNMCVEMLQEGWHRAFAELFIVLDSDRSRREAVAPSSSDETLLENQQDKMETMKMYLIQAEQAERTGSCTMVCEQLLSLGQYFTAPEDRWISLHFLHKCTDREKGGCSKAAIEAHMCLAQLYLQQGELEEAEHHADMCNQQAEDSGRLESAGRPLRLQTRCLLWKIYNHMADAPLDAGDYDKALALLHKGYTKATESEDKQIQGEAMYRLGLTYQSARDHDTAKQYFNSYIEICKALQDARGLGMGYTAMSKSLQSQGKIDESIQCLQTLKDISLSNSMPRILLDACMCLGDIFYSRNQYEQAVEHYLQSYHLVTELRDTALLQKTQVLVGNARAHFMIGEYSANMLSTSHSALQKLVTWKDTREWQALCADPADYTAAVQH